jgi:hypothetical protein
VTVDSRLALFLMLGQSAERTIRSDPQLVPAQTLPISASIDVAESLPGVVSAANNAAEAYRLFFVFETYLRELIVEVLSNNATVPWWDKIPPDVRKAIEELEETEEMKSWMALGTRDKSSLMTYPQLVRVIDECWKDGFADLLRDKALVQEARVLSHLRNTIAHMTPISDEEVGRVRLTIRDWFRMVAP